MSYAFESAYILSQIFNNEHNVSASKYARKTFSIKMKLFLKLLKNPFLYNQFLRTLVMKSSFQSIDVIED